MKFININFKSYRHVFFDRLRDTLTNYEVFTMSNIVNRSNQSVIFINQVNFLISLIFCLRLLEEQDYSEKLVGTRLILLPEGGDFKPLLQCPCLLNPSRCWFFTAQIGLFSNLSLFLDTQHLFRHLMKTQPRVTEISPTRGSPQYRYVQIVTYFRTTSPVGQQIIDRSDPSSLCERTANY